MAEFSEEKRPGAAVAKKKIEHEKLFFQIKDRKITIGQVTTGQFGSEQGATYTHKRTHANAHACTRTHTHTHANIRLQEPRTWQPCSASFTTRAVRRSLPARTSTHKHAQGHACLFSAHHMHAYTRARICEGVHQDSEGRRR